jgi:hypothetical protein
MNCKDARKEFLTLLDGDLGLTERAPLEVHLDECRECWWELERLQRRSALPRAIWRARLALGNLGLLEAVSLAKTIKELPRRAFSRVPSRVFLVAVTVALMVVLVTYGFQRRSELRMALDHGAPEASPVRQDSPRPASPPAAALASESEAPTISPKPGAAAPVSGPTAIPHARPRLGAVPGLHAAVAAPVRPTAGAKPPAGSSALWVMGHTRDEQIVPETAVVRQDRD